MKYFLDLDNTVTESRGKISQKMFDLLSKLDNVVIISGAEFKQIRSQIGDLNCLVMAQNGNHNPFWKRFLTQEEKEKISQHIDKYSEDFVRLVYSSNVFDMYEDRGCQIGFSLTGHHAPVEIKRAFDPDGRKRREILDKYPLPEGIECRIGGTTTMDYFAKGLNKGYNVKKLLEILHWKPEECMYIGDALFPGGNDETVIGIIPTHAVKNHEETYEYLSSHA